MPVTPELLERARKGKRQAVVMLVAEYYPYVYRLAYALSGREQLGRPIVKRVVRQSLPAMKKWTHTGDPFRWFVHHSVLLSRQKIDSEIDLVADPLIRGVATTSAYYPAFIRALRTLPMQQRESYILHHGEGFDIRGLAIAMDCSQEAAANHLREATSALAAYAGDFFPAFTANLAQTYRALTPPEELIVPAVQSSLRKGMFARIARGLSAAIKLLVILAVLYLCWRIVPMLKW